MIQSNTKHCVLAAAIGSLTYGFAISILGNTFSKPDFYVYMNISLTGPDASTAESWIAAWNCVLYVGALIGHAIYPWISAKHGRRIPLAIGSVCVIVGGAMQAGEVNSVMLCISRIIIGVGIGNILPGTPIYQAEIAPSDTRGFMVGMHACFVGAGIALAQWIGVAFFHLEGQVSWRVPMAFQCLPPIALLCVLFFLPESPRWLYLNGQEEAAENILILLHKDDEDPIDSATHKEFILMKAQIDLEAEETNQGIRTIFTNPHLRKRFMIGWLTMTGTQASGAVVILTYAVVIYGGAGISPFAIGIVTGTWSTLLAVGNFFGGMLADKMGRVRQITLGLIGCLLCLTVMAILTALFAGTNDKSGNDTAIFFIFLFVVFYSTGIESPSMVYSSEIFPGAWRPYGVAFSFSAVPFWDLIWTGVASPAFAHIGWRFYMVFASMTAAMTVVVYFYFPETKGYTLEQISEAFGDKIVAIKEGEVGDLKTMEIEIKEPHQIHEEVENV